jgi:histone acetyltransferase (RNA polymerase elongator complex component)
VSTRPDCIDQTVLERLKAYGVRTVELGAQSMDDQVLTLSRRGHTAQDVERAAAQVKAHGLTLILQLMAGLPGDTRDICRQSALRAAALKPDGVRIYPTVVTPHTALCVLWQKGDYQALSVEEAAEWCADALEVFEQADIPVLRVGLNPTEALAKQVLAGAYHPAMGELARGALCLRKMRVALLPYQSGRGQAVLLVPPGETSRWVGQKRRNLTALAAEFPGLSLCVREQTGQRGVRVCFTPAKL